MVYTLVVICCIFSPLFLRTEQASPPVYSDFYRDQFRRLYRYELVRLVQFSSANLKNVSLKTKYFQINAFGKSYDFSIRTLYEPTSSGIPVEYVGRNNTVQGKFLYDNGCLYKGLSANNNSIELVLNHCDGLQGFIRTRNETLFIEPLKQFSPLKPFHRKHLVYRSIDVVPTNLNRDWVQPDPNEALNTETTTNSTRRRSRRSGYNSFLIFVNKSRRKVQIYYVDSFNRKTRFITLGNQRQLVNTYEGTIWLAKDDKTDQPFLINGNKQHRTSANLNSRRVELVVTRPEGMVFEESNDSNEVIGSQHHIEALVVADKSVIDYHGKGLVEKYLVTLMMMAAYIFKDKTLGVNINLELVKLVILEEDDDETFHVHMKSPRRTLQSACQYISSLRHADENHIDHFDIGFAITKKDFGPSGYAQLYSMCSSTKSCAIVQDEGLTSSFIVAHETAHLLGLDHDGEGEASACNSEKSRGSVMAPLIVARYDRFHWSKCSREVMRENLIYFNCLHNQPKNKIKKGREDLPGALYTLDEQCQFNFNKTSSICRAFSFNPCHTLWCQESHARNCITRRGPALDGSTCDRNKHCIQGECVTIGNREGKKEKKLIVHGNWGSWTTWVPCSQTCGIGVRYRRRSCNNPPPGPGGKKCTGNEKDMDICNTRDCLITKRRESLMEEQCAKLQGKGWVMFSDSDLKNRMKSEDRLNCSFDDGLCNWRVDVRSRIHWLLHTGETPSFKTGPEDDHSKRDGTGKYIYMEASSTNDHLKREGDRARIISPLVRVPRICIRFFYHMWGKDIGSLIMKIKFQNGTEFNRWSESGNKGNRWNAVSLSVQSLQMFQVVFEAVRGVHWSGDIAVDDITVHLGMCPADVQDGNLCKVSCRSADSRSFKIDVPVTDGVNCGGERRNDFCIQGKCVNYGCNNQFDSKLELDNCGICGGDGTSCSKQKGRKNIKMNKEIEILITLHKGSTFINLTKESSGKHYFGLRSTSSKETFYSSKLEEYVIIEGSTFHFKRTEYGLQKVSSKGPIKKDLEVMVYVRGSSTAEFTLAYEYFSPLKSVSRFELRETGWQKCSQSCGAGTQVLNFRCTRIEDQMQVNEEFCRNLKKPRKIRVCNLKPCNDRYDWVTGDWNECSKTCEGGEQSRTVLCVRQHDRAIAPSYLCQIKRPDLKRICNIETCPTIYIWRSHEWNKCSCDGAYKTRLVSCVEEATNLIVRETLCEKKARPETFQPCGLIECQSFKWQVTHVGVCSLSCGGGMMMRIINCVKKDDSKVIVQNDYCDGPAPPRILTCNEHACPEYEWDIGEQSPCSVTCGAGEIKRSIHCVEKLTRLLVNDSHCKQVKPEEKLLCIEANCTSYKVSYGNWERCDALCGNGIQRRKYKCVNEHSVVQAYTCGGEKIKDTQPCRINECLTKDDLKCDFDDESMCNWKNIRNDDFDWSVAQRTPSYQTGPMTDHTTKQGYFVYIEASRPRIKGDKSFISSPYVRERRGCLVFWYHMSGSTVGRLRLFVTSNSTSRVLFDREGHVSRRWMFQKIDVNTTNVPFPHAGYQFVFEARVGNGAYGDIALDDIEFHSKSCQDASIVYNPILQNCREISPLCRHSQKRTYCLASTAYRTLCCETCARYYIKLN